MKLLFIIYDMVYCGFCSFYVPFLTLKLLDHSNVKHQNILTNRDLNLLPLRSILRCVER